MRLFIIPAEPLLFRRSGSSFSAGGYAVSLFPPTPETIQGAIRAAIATHWDRSLTIAETFKQPELLKLIGSYDRYGAFHITSMAVGRQSRNGAIERLFPAPAFLQKSKDGIVTLRPKQLENVQSNMPENMWYLCPDKKEREKLKPLGWLSETNLLKALRGGSLSLEDAIDEDTIRAFEARLGIGMNNETKSTREGLLYQLRMVRMNHTIESEYTYGFVVDVRLAKAADDGAAGSAEQFIDDSQTRKELHLPKEGWITLGGERRAARFEIIDMLEGGNGDSLEQAKQGKILYLATPAGFREGWKPINWQPKKWRRPLPGAAAVAIDHYQSVGGWLLTPGTSGGEDKPILRCVPAGSVYYFKEPVTVEQPFTDHGWQIGYGIAYAGDWKE